MNHDFISRAAHHASQQPHICHHITTIAVLPRFYESSHTVAMKKHGMDVVKQDVQFLNKSRTNTYFSYGQALFGIAKHVQWCLA